MKVSHTFLTIKHQPPPFKKNAHDTHVESSWPPAATGATPPLPTAAPALRVLPPEPPMARADNLTTALAALQQGMIILHKGRSGSMAAPR